MSSQTGTLFGIGVGPGDPELVTIKAAKILGRVDIVFAAASTRNHHSLARDIARPHVPETTPIKLLKFPMTRDKKETHSAWEMHARTIINALEEGKDVAFLTLGDAMTYSTLGYIVRYISTTAPHLTIETIPGISSYQAAAARLNTPLVEGEESLMVVSGAKGGDRLRALAGEPENIVFLKAYRNVKDITEAISESGAYQQCVGIKNCGHENEEIISDVEELNKQAPNYWTLIIAKKKREDDPS
ncbi:MAG: precorrin-2 C(20)-methyltransferase [Desulfobacterales bacterium]|nr:precorrin-2 C(20)-methyltransferase [Desulfobacterales bacterium]